MNKAVAIISAVVCVILIGCCIFFSGTKSGVSIINSWKYGLQKTDDDTNYQTIKQVEDTCRSMIASYNSDKMTYEQYKDSDSIEKVEWAEQAKMRANKTASTYNNYIIKNSFVWKNDVPVDIYMDLAYLE